MLGAAWSCSISTSVPTAPWLLLPVLVGSADQKVDWKGCCIEKVLKKIHWLDQHKVMFANQRPKRGP